MFPQAATTEADLNEEEHEEGTAGSKKTNGERLNPGEVSEAAGWFAVNHLSPLSLGTLRIH